MGGTESKQEKRYQEPEPKQWPEEPERRQWLDKPKPPNPLTTDPWREQTDWSVQREKTLVSQIKNISPQKKPRLGLIGPVGAGKSSFINSVLSIGKGYKCALAGTGPSSSSYTTHFERFTEKNLLQRYRLVDCMGIEPSDGHGFHPEDIIAILKGHVLRDYTFNPAKPISEEDPSWNPTPKFNDQIHCVVFVISSKSMYYGIPKEYVQKIGILQEKIKTERIPRVLILTQVDLLCDEVRNDISKMFHSVKVQKAVNTASEVFGIDKASIHPVKNYEVDIELNHLTNIPILLALRQAMHYAKDRVDHVLYVESDESD